MSTFHVPDSDHPSLRATAARIDSEIDRLRRAHEGDVPNPVNALVAYWADFINQLALRLVPEVRTCPTCGRVCMRNATRCGYCWAALAADPT